MPDARRVTKPLRRWYVGRTCCEQSPAGCAQHVRAINLATGSWSFWSADDRGDLTVFITIY
jgi:hypothetical protein